LCSWRRLTGQSQCPRECIESSPPHACLYPSNHSLFSLHKPGCDVQNDFTRFIAYPRVGMNACQAAFVGDRGCQQLLQHLICSTACPPCTSSSATALLPVCRSTCDRLIYQSCAAVLRACVGQPDRFAAYCGSDSLPCTTNIIDAFPLSSPGANVGSPAPSTTTTTVKTSTSATTTTTTTTAAATTSAATAAATTTVTMLSSLATTLPVVVGATTSFFYGDYDNVVVAAVDKLFYTSALTPEAIARENGTVSATFWAPATSLGVEGVHNAKGAVFCGKQYGKADRQGGKYGQIFVADEGDATHPGRVIGWDVTDDAANPAAIKLVAGSAWNVYAPLGATPSDVECGPKNGLFIADKGTNAIYWVSAADLQAKKSNYTQVVPATCGAVVAEVRSIAYSRETERLIWTNNDEAVAENSGIFSVPQFKDGVAPVACKADKCNTWSQACSSQVNKVDGGSAVAKKQWAVAAAWGGLQVSNGDANVYNATRHIVATVPQEATYADATADPQRDVLLVTDAKEGAVYTVNQGVATVHTILVNVPGAHGVAYNNAWGWPGASCKLVMSVGAVLLALANLL
jgi:hypothetical protein